MPNRAPARPKPRTWRRFVPGIADWSFAFKMGFLPSLGLAALLAVVAIAVASLDEQVVLTNAVVAQDLNMATRFSANALRLQRVDSGLYRVLALQAAHSMKQPVRDQIAILLANLDQVIDDLRSYRAHLTDPGKARQVQALVDDLGTYRGAVDVVGSMLELDFASAVAMVQPFDGNTRSILAALSGLVESVTHDAAARAAQSVQAAQRARAAFALTAAGLSLALAVLGFMITRATIRSVDSIAKATVLVARGDRSVNIDRLARRDELGAIVESLQAFQDNVARVAFLAHHDALTGLPNRTLFNDRLNAALAQIGRGTRFAVLCLDLDRFKAVNDTLGHPVGDMLLREVADRIYACVREGDTVARLGGDEFAVILLDTTSTRHPSRVAERIIAALNESFDIEGQSVSIGCSIGVAVAPDDGLHPAKLLKSADTALYRAKTEGRNSHRFFEAAMDTQLQLRHELEIDMRRAIAAQEFVMYYQPLVNVARMQISGFEALLRWAHPERGMISPADFIPVAEETGLIVALGEFALMQACRDAALWPEPVKVAVNLSSVQFKDMKLLNLVLRALETSGLAPSRLELEITESVLLHRSADTITVLTTLRERGIRISMDDFGTGYSSLSYLRSFPFDKIKIDQSFVRDLSEKEESVAIVRAVTGLGGSLGVATTAEGVETKEQFERLALEGCTEVQGYLFGRPTPADRVPITLAEFGPRAAASIGRPLSSRATLVELPNCAN